MLGYTPEEVRELHTWDWDVKWKPEQLLEMGRLVDSKGLHLGTQPRRKDGTIFDVEISINGAVCAGQKLIFCVCRDVTEHKQLVENIRYHASLVETVSDAIVSSDKDYKLISWNKGAEEMYGWREEEVIGGNILDILKPVFLNVTLEDIQAFLDENGYWKGESIHQRKNGEKLHVLDSISVRRDAQGNNIGAVTVFKDITSLSNIMTKKSLAIVAMNFLKRMAGKDVPFYDVEMLKQNGERRVIQISAVAVHKGDKIVGDLAILRDITEIKKAEKNLKLQKVLIDRVLATIPNAVLLLNKNLNVIMANQAFYKLFKLKKNRVERKSINEIIIMPDLDQAIKKILDSKEEKTSAELRYTIGVSEKILLVNIFAMKEEDLLLVINDVTEEREKQERLYLTDRVVSVGDRKSTRL